MALQKEEYEEPQCLLCGMPGEKGKQAMIPQQRISRKLDEYMGCKDYAGAERHLKYWLASTRERFPNPITENRTRGIDRWIFMDFKN